MTFTLIIIIITCLISIGSFSNPGIYNAMIMYPPAVNRGQYYRLLTSGFIHADYSHLLFNMLTFYFFGQPIEGVLHRELGMWAFPLFYVLAIVVSDIPSYLKHKNDSNYASLGASGGVSAVVFAYIMFAPWAWFAFPPLPAIVYGIGYLIYCVYMGRRGGDNINHDAHFYGALFGIAFIFVTMPEQFKYFLELLMHPQGP